MSASSLAAGERSLSGDALRASGALWFVTAVAGQWAFVTYIAGFYGPTLVSGNFAAWDRNTMQTDAYVAGDGVGNLFFAAHVALAAILTVGGSVQLVPQIRAHAIVLHRWNGRLFVTAAIAAALAGLYLQWVRGTALRSPSGIVPAIATTLDGVLILAFAALAFRAVRRRDIAAHQRWATRLFLVVNGVWFLRVGYMAWTDLAPASFEAFPFFRYWSFGAYLLPLAMYELYRRAQGAGATVQYAVAGIVLALSVATSVGSVAAFYRMWQPLLLLPSG